MTSSENVFGTFEEVSRKEDDDAEDAARHTAQVPQVFLPLRGRREWLGVEKGVVLGRNAGAVLAQAGEGHVARHVQPHLGCLQDAVLLPRMD